MKRPRSVAPVRAAREGVAVSLRTERKVILERESRRLEMGGARRQPRTLY